MRQQLKTLELHKKKGFLAILAIMLICILICCIQILKPNQQYHYDGEYRFISGEATSPQLYLGPVALKPGVYYIEQEYECDVVRNGHLNVTDGTVFTGGLLSNGEHAYPALGKTGYHIWLFEGTDQLMFTAEYSGDGTFCTKGVTITETNQLWTYYLTIVLFAGALCLLAFGFYHYNKLYPVALSKKGAFFGVCTIILIASTPQLLNCCFNGADMTYHLLRIEGVKDGLISGQFPIRIEPEWLFDHGYANAIFYCNALLLFPAILRLLGFTITQAFNLYCIGLNIATAVIAYYCFSRIFKNWKIGIASSALYTLSIIRLYKLVMVGAIGEASAMTFMPLLLYGLYRVFTEDSDSKDFHTAWIPISLSYAGLIQTHVLSCEITAFFTILICLLNIRKVFQRKRFLALAEGAIGAVILSFWYLVPFLDYYLTQDVCIKHASARTIQFEGLEFTQLIHPFFPVGTEKIQDSLFESPTGVGPVLFVGLLVFAGLWIVRKLPKKDAAVGFSKRLSLVCALFLCMSLKRFPWDKIQFVHPIVASLVSSLQFPNRFLGWGTAMLVFLFGYLLLRFDASRKYGRGFAYGAMVTLAIFSITACSMFLIDHINANNGRYYIYHEEGMGFGYISGGEYIIYGTNADEITFETPAAAPGVIMSDYRKQYLEITAHCENTTGSESYVDMPLMLYKGYQAKDLATGEPLSLCYDDNYRIRVLLPAGYNGSFELKFASPVYWRISEAVTFCGYVFLIGYCVITMRKKNNKEKEQ